MGGGQTSMNLELLFPIHLREAMKNLVCLQDLEEIRVRIGQPIFLYTREKEYELPYRMTEADILEMQNYISNYSIYAWKEELRNGYLTIQGGHRIGLAGGTTNEKGQISGISYLTFFNIRIAHEKIGCSKTLLSYLQKEGNGSQADIYNTLIVSPPGAGKTTLLRDCIRNLSCGGKKIALVDERSEIAASYQGIPQNDVGPRTDVLDGCNKPEGIFMLLRSMAPEIIAVDELGTEEDFKAVELAAYSGCRLLGTVHAGNIKELAEKPHLKKWCEKGLFERFVFIEKGEQGMRQYKVYDNHLNSLC